MYPKIQCFCKVLSRFNISQYVFISSVAKSRTTRITLPHRTIENHKKAVLKKKIKEHQAQRKYKGPLLISCKRKQFNHYQGQFYSDFNPQHLASGGWKHNKSKEDYFTILGNKGNPALELSENIENFAALGLRKDICNSLENYNIVKPTEIQAKAIPSILSGKNVLYAAETGSGKTLAFLLPIIHRALENIKLNGPQKIPNRPMAIIMAPSRELVDQIHDVVADLGRPLNLQTKSICGGRGTQRLLRHPPVELLDILVASPQVLSKVLTNRIYDLSALSFIVLDEIDTLLDDSFNELTLRLLRKLNTACTTFSTPVTTTSAREGEDAEENASSSPSTEMSPGEEVNVANFMGLQAIMTGATMPRSIETIIGDTLPLDTFEYIKTGSIHRLMPHVPQKFLRLLNNDKPEKLLLNLQHNIKKQIPTIVFFNKTNNAIWMHKTLEEAGIHTGLLHAQMSQKRREGRFERFQNQEHDVILCTDIASRGLDTLRVQHVINYDFPLFMSDYIHRVGRVGRVGSQGAGFVLSYVTHKWDVDLLWKIESAARTTTELHNVNANIKRKINSIVKEKFHEPKLNL